MGMWITFPVISSSNLNIRAIDKSRPTEVLLGEKIEAQEDLPHFAKKLAKEYTVSVLLKAGHLTQNELIDVFYNYETQETLKLSSQRLYTPNTHGTGCTLSSALAAFLARGFSLNDAVIQAKKYISEALSAGAEYRIGKGHGPVHHFYNFWE